LTVNFQYPLDEHGVPSKYIFTSCIYYTEYMFSLRGTCHLGLIHPDLIELFHNQIQHGRVDAGRYIWNIDVVRLMRGRMGAGRLHAWERTVDYPNFGQSGLRDFTELADFQRLYDPQLEGKFVRHLRSDLLRFPSYLKEKIALQYFLGNYMLAWTLAEGKRSKIREELEPISKPCLNSHEIVINQSRLLGQPNLVGFEIASRSAKYRYFSRASKISL
jgi:hypothetical protein